MKTYIFNALNQYKSLGEQLDVNATLCNKSWYIFNDSGDKELLIFQTNGTIILTHNGVGVKGSWEYIPANKSILLGVDNIQYMMHPAIIDNTIFVLNQDGTNKCLFLMDEKNPLSLQYKRLNQIDGYFKRKKIEKEESARIEEEKRNEKELEKRLYEIASKRYYELMGLAKWPYLLQIFLMPFLMISLGWLGLESPMPFLGCIGFVAGPFFGTFIASKVERNRGYKIVEDYVRSHPNYDITKYIEEKLNEEKGKTHLNPYLR